MEQKSIPVSKVQRASNFIKTSAKVGGNYVKHYTKKLVNPDLSRDELDKSNAEDIFQSMSTLRGGALKMAQMISMDQNFLPEAYQEKFALARSSAPPLSYPLLINTFRKYLGNTPEHIFDTFNKTAKHAASIGQVHEATLKGKKLAIKVQYPGVGDSISSDLKIIKPLITTLFNITSSELSYYTDEIEKRLKEETDYSLEMKRGTEISKACEPLQGLAFPTYYPEHTSEKILTMDWLEGTPFDRFIETPLSQDQRNALGQAIWDFYDYSIHVLKKVHADPHTGNFIITPDLKVGILDFGCVKEIPEDFYKSYYKLHNPDTVQNDELFLEALLELNFILPDDSKEQKTLFIQLFKEMIQLFGQPFHNAEFDFGNEAFFQQIFEKGEQMSKTREIRKSKMARGPKHLIYINRTYFGLFHLLHQLKAKVQTHRFNPQFAKSA